MQSSTEVLYFPAAETTTPRRNNTKRKPGHETINESQLYNLVASGDIWNKFNVVKSPDDGHCLLHSVVESMRSQFNCNNIDIEKLIQCIEKETVENNHFYIVAADDMSNSNLQHGLELYIKSKVSDTRFGDLVPVIIANALCVNIAVVSETSAESRILNYRNCSLISYTNTIFVSKTDEHYNGMHVRKLASMNMNCACNICCHNAAVPTQTHGIMQLSAVGSERTQPSEAPCEIDDPINDVDSRGSGFCCSTVVTETKHVQSEISSPVTKQMSKCTGKQLSNNNIKHANNEEALHEGIYTVMPTNPYDWDGT